MMIIMMIIMLYSAYDKFQLLIREHNDISLFSMFNVACECECESKNHRRLPTVTFKLEAGSEDDCRYVLHKGSVVSAVLKDSVFALTCGWIVKVHQVRRLPTNEIILKTRAVSDLRALFTSTLDSRELGVFKSNLEVSRKELTIRPSELV